MMKHVAVPHEFGLKQLSLLLERVGISEDHHSSSDSIIPTIDNAAGVDPWIRCKNPGPSQAGMVARKIKEFCVLSLVSFSS
jgi:hypothetical protein